MRLAIVVARWNSSMTLKLRDGALGALQEKGCVGSDVSVFEVPGAFELPLACLTAAKSGTYDAVIALGVVIRGDTPHFDFVAGQCARGIMKAGLETGIPVLFGVITADTEQQALDRCGEKADNKGYEAAVSAVEMVDTMRRIRFAGRGEKALPHVV
ncbi:MAG: 6,7-dimethyl-8-ribityllumazine synthase [Acidobacteria bacterium]|nr:6,7-dimethyl-8-ribityllumazine synthase [Acidobacteriota bacterium]